MLKKVFINKSNPNFLIKKSVYCRELVCSSMAYYIDIVGHGSSHKTDVRLNDQINFQVDLIFPRSWENIHIPTVILNWYSNECCARGQMEWRPRAHVRKLTWRQRKLFSKQHFFIHVVSSVLSCCWTDRWQQNLEKCYIMV